MGNDDPMRPKVRSTGRGRRLNLAPLVLSIAVWPALAGCSSFFSSSAPSAPSASSAPAAASAPPAQPATTDAAASSGGTSVGSLRQSYVGFLNAFRDEPIEQTPASPPPASPPPNQLAAAVPGGPGAQPGPMAVAAVAPPPATSSQYSRPVQPGYSPPSAPPNKPPAQPSAAASPGPSATAAASTPPATNPPPTTAERPYLIDSIRDIFK